MEGRGNLEKDRREGEEKKGEGGERRWRRGWRKQGKRRRRRNVIWRNLDGEDLEERRVLMEKFMEVVLDRKVG